MTKFFSLDIETTGLNPDTCQILEIAVVFYDTEILMPVEKRPFIRRPIHHEVIQGEPYALAMNSRLLSEIARGYAEGVRIKSAIFNLREFVDKVDPGANKINWLGKNVSGFDLKFLSKELQFGLCLRHHHRAFDLGSFFFDPKIDTDCLPSLKQCMERVGIEGEVPHTALEDARMVVECVDRKLRA